ncbi:MAG: hypothetical protein NVSMB47_04050 [Polyangiales bacterium]
MSPRSVPALLITALGACVLTGGPSVALGKDAGLPIVIRNVGPKRLRVRVASGNVAPCDSLADESIFSDTLKPGAVVERALTVGECVCVEQTYEPFPDVGWGQARFQCRPVICHGSGKARLCRPDPDPTIRIDLSSGP